MCNMQVKASILVIWKIEVFLRKHFLQKQEIFIANNISVVVKDEEKAELFIRSHKKSLIFKVAKAGRHRNLNNLNYGTKSTTSDPVYLGCHVAVAPKTSAS